jgi:hypothetical protein
VRDGVHGGDGGQPQRQPHHLLIVDTHVTQVEFRPNFSHLVQLQGLILDHASEYTYSTVFLDRSSFAKPSKMRRFISKLKIDFEADLFSEMNQMEWLSLSSTAVKWDIFPQLMNRSLCQMPSLIRLDLAGFTSEFGDSPTQAKFRPKDVFAGCNLPGLRHLDLSNNYISILTSDFYVPFPGLTVLDLTFNLLVKTNFYSTYIGKFEFAKVLFLNQLHTLDMSHQMRPVPLSKLASMDDLTKELDIPFQNNACNTTENYYWAMKIILNFTYDNYWMIRHLCISMERMIAHNLMGSQNLEYFIRSSIDIEIIFPRCQFRSIEISNNAFFKFT